MPREKETKRGSKDPMVAIYSPNLRAAIRDKGTTIAELARKLRTNPQTIAYLASGDEIKRSRASRRAQMAKILKVDEPFLSTRGSMSPTLMAGLNVTVGLGVFVSPRTQLAFGRLLEKCLKATERDLRIKALRDRGVEEPASPGEVKEWVTRCMGRLTDIGEQRGDVLVGAEQPYFGVMVAGGIIRGRHLPYDADEEEAGIGLVAAWEQILEPWFSGNAKMNYRRLLERAGFPVPAGERRSDTNPYIIVWQPEKGAP